MKSLSIIILALVLTSFQTKDKLSIPSEKTVTIENSKNQNNYFKIYNSSIKAIEVAVIDQVTKLKTRSFGLDIYGKVYVKVEPNSSLTIKNPSKSNISIHVKKVVQKDNPIAQKYIKFTLHNSTDKSIALHIPGVMNPNLSPNSDSGVSLKIGQKIYYKKRGRSKLLLEVTEEIKNGDVLNVAELIEELEKNS